MLWCSQNLFLWRATRRSHTFSQITHNNNCFWVYSHLFVEITLYLMKISRSTFFLHRILFQLRKRLTSLLINKSLSKILFKHRSIDHLFLSVFLSIWRRIFITRSLFSFFKILRKERFQLLIQLFHFFANFDYEVYWESRWWRIVQSF